MPTPTGSSPVQDVKVVRPPLLLDAGIGDFVRLRGVAMRHRAGERVWEPRPAQEFALAYLLEGEGSIRLVSQPDVPVCRLYAGDFFAEHEIFRSAILSSADVVAESDCEVSLLSEEAAWDLFERWPYLCTLLARQHHLRCAAMQRTAEKHLERFFRPYALSTIDPLTGALNAQAMNRNFRRQAERHQRAGEPSTIATFQITNLADIENYIGPSAADDALAMLYSVIDRECRPTDLKGRDSQMSIAVLLGSVSSEQAAEIVERVTRAIDTHISVSREGVPLPVMISTQLREFAVDSASARDSS